MRRRPVIAALAAGCASNWPLPATAQSRRRPRLGVLANFPVMDPVDWKWLWRGMAQLGWEVEMNLDVDWTFAMNDWQKYRVDAQQMVASGVDVLLAIGANAAEAAVQATKTIPIVIISAAALETGYAKSLARPTGNVTGVVSQALDLAGKGLDLLRAFRPDLRRVGLVHLAGDTLSERWLKAWRDAVGSSSITIVPLPYLQSQADVEPMQLVAAREAVQALVTEGPAPMMLGAGFDRLLAWTIDSRIISFSTSRLRGVHLVTFGPDPVDMRRIALAQIDRILRGTKPADIPIVLASRFDLTVDRRVARAMGIAIPQSVLLQATEVIE